MLIQKRKNKNITVEYIIKKKIIKKSPCTKREPITRAVSSSLFTILSVKSNSDLSVGNEQRRDVRLAYWMQED